MSTRGAQLLAGVAIVALGVWMVASPLVVAEALGRPSRAASQVINLRASWGGTLLGIGAFVAWLPALRPWRRSLVGLLGWVMAGIGVARAVGFVVDGGPDTLQWVWLVAEVVIAAGCAAFLWRHRGG